MLAISSPLTFICPAKELSSRDSDPLLSKTIEAPYCLGSTELDEVELDSELGMDDGSEEGIEEGSDEGIDGVSELGADGASLEGSEVSSLEAGASVEEEGSSLEMSEEAASLRLMELEATGELTQLAKLKAKRLQRKKRRLFIDITPL